MTLRDMTPTPVALPNGIILNYIREGAGQPLILIHGAMGDFGSWEPQWREFTQHYDCISYSRRYSDPNPNELTSRNHSALVDAEDLKGFMDALNINTAILVGSSYGGFTALAMAVRSPKRVSAVVAVEAPMMRYAFKSKHGRNIAQAFLAAADDPAREAFEKGDDELGVRILTAGIIGKDASDIPTQVMERRMRNAKAARSLSLSQDEFPLLDETELAALNMPVLLMKGGETADVHSVIFDEVAKAMPQATSMVIEGSGHSVSQQRPTLFNSQVLKFLDEQLSSQNMAI